MSYGDHIQQARNALTASLLERPAPPFSAHDLAARDLLIGSLAEMAAQIIGPADTPPGNNWQFDKAVMARPAVAMNRLLAAAVVTLPAPDPSSVLGGAIDEPASLQNAAKQVALAGADLASDRQWQSQTAQQWVVTKDIADLTRATALLDTTRRNHEQHPLPNRQRLLLAASAATQVATSGHLDFAVDTTTRTQMIQLPDGDFSPNLREAFQRQQLVAARLDEIPSYRNLQQILRHQRRFSLTLRDQLAHPVDRALGIRHAERHLGYLRITRELHSINGNIGRGNEAATNSEHASAIIRFQPLQDLRPDDRNLLAALTSVTERVDDAVANCIQKGLLEGIYHVHAPDLERHLDAYKPHWVTDGLTQRDIGSSHWIRATSPAELPIWQLADNLRTRPAATNPAGAKRRGLRDSLDQILARSGNGPRPERPHQR